MTKILEITKADILNRFNESGPYYTSYPTLGHWSKHFKNKEHKNALYDYFTCEGKDAPLHIYLHIPFCAKLCYYCICNIVVTNNREKIQYFLNYLLKEIDLLREFCNENGIKPNIKEIHFGGGTPSHLYNDQFTQLVDKLRTLVDFKTLDEVTMKIDPRTTTKENLHHFAALGVTRISFGVQDFDPKVQEAINRVQPPEMIDALLTPETRALFSGVNFDLLYGLPYQTRETFSNTIKLVNKFYPERITLLKYAHAPEIRKHMMMIKEMNLPKVDQLPLMFFDSVESLLEQGYVWVGIDNFAKPTDDLAIAAQKKTTWRTFNGFTPGRTNNMIGLGPTSTAAFGSYYSQSAYELNEYYEAIDTGQFPIIRGYKLDQDDLIRRDVIFGLLCAQKVDFGKLGEKYGVNGPEYFRKELEKLNDNFKTNSVVTISNDVVEVTNRGRFLIRTLCKIFDKFNEGQYKMTGP